jgi:hypothetical protein
MLEALRRQLEAMLSTLTNLRLTDENRLKLYEAAVKALGTDASPNDVAPDELGCAETVNELVKNTFGEYINARYGITSTYWLYKALKENILFKEVFIPSPGDVVISPTGYGKNPAIPNGHTGIVMLGGKIASNDSRTGKFEENYTIDTWSQRYVRNGGYFMKFFRRI